MSSLRQRGRWRCLIDLVELANGRLSDLRRFRPPLRAVLSLAWLSLAFALEYLQHSFKRDLYCFR
jgi:hypothetical protein